MEKTSRSSLKKALITSTILGASLFAAEQAHAQGFETDNKKKTGQVTLSDDPATVDQKLENMIGGYLRAEANSSPSEHGFFGSGQLTLRPDDDTRLNFYALGGWQEYDNDGEDLEVASTRIMAELGHYFTKTRNLEVYAAGLVGKEWNDFSKAIDMRADRMIYGGKFGIASQENGTRLLLTAYGGNGDYDAELLSGFKNEGDFDTFFLGGEVTQRLFGENKKANTRGEFEFNRDLGEEFERALYLSIQAYTRNDKYGELQEADGTGVRVGFPYVLNMREHGRDAKGNIYAEGVLWEITPFAQWDNYKTKADLSERVTDADKFRLGLHVRAQLNQYVGLSVEGGYQWYNLGVKDPGQLTNTDEEKNGGFVAGSVEIRF